MNYSSDEEETSKDYLAINASNIYQKKFQKGLKTNKNNQAKKLNNSHVITSVSNTSGGKRYGSPLRIQTYHKADKYSPLQSYIETSPSHNKNQSLYSSSKQHSPLYVKAECPIHTEEYFYGK